MAEAITPAIVDDAIVEQVALRNVVIREKRLGAGQLQATARHSLAYTVDQDKGLVFTFLLANLQVHAIRKDEKEGEGQTGETVVLYCQFEDAGLRDAAAQFSKRQSSMGEGEDDEDEDEESCEGGFTEVTFYFADPQTAFHWFNLIALWIKELDAAARPEDNSEEEATSGDESSNDDPGHDQVHDPVHDQVHDQVRES